MNLDQLRYICAVYDAGSISRAAEKLFLSQPNLSSAISKLEYELGFAIFLRSHSGVKFTDKGLALVQHASHILEECGSIQRLHAQPSLRHFRVITPHYPPVDNAFVRLCAELEKIDDLPQLDLQLSAKNWQGSLIELHKKTAELAVTCVPEETLQSFAFRRSLERHCVEFYPLAKTSVVVKLAKSHPLLVEDPFPFEKLALYPMITYSPYEDSLSAYGGIRLPFKNKPSCIYVDSGRTRSHLIAQTNAWGIAMKLPKKHEEDYGIRYVEFPDSLWSIGYLRDPARPTDELERRFFALLDEELSFLQQQ